MARGECVPSASQLVSKSAPVRAELVPQSRRSLGRVARSRVNLKKFNIFPRRCTQWRLRAHLVPSPRDASSPVRATSRPCARRRAWRAVALLRATRARGVTRRGARWNEVCARWVATLVRHWCEVWLYGAQWSRDHPIIGLLRSPDPQGVYKQHLWAT